MSWSIWLVPLSVWVGEVWLKHGLKWLQECAFTCWCLISPLWSPAIQPLAASEESWHRLFIYLFKFIRLRNWENQVQAGNQVWDCIKIFSTLKNSAFLNKLTGTCNKLNCTGRNKTSALTSCTGHRWHIKNKNHEIIPSTFSLNRK